MKPIFTSLAFALAFALPVSVFAAPTLLTTIKPIALIAKDIAGESATVEVLLPDSASPHDYALKPSDVKKIHDADAVIWVGPEVELFLQKTLEGKDNTVRLTALADMPLRYFDEDEESNDDHGHHGHSHEHGDVDGHIWLGPEQSKAIARAVRDSLVKLDPAQEEVYQQNYAAFAADVDSAVADLSARFARQPNPGYFLFHDAYGYFEQAFNLAPTGHLTINPERKPGAKTLVSIRKAFQEGKASCVFSEPQFNPAMVESLVKGTGASVLVLDPMASGLDLEAHHYTDFLNGLGEQYLSCFENKPSN